LRSRPMEPSEEERQAAERARSWLLLATGVLLVIPLFLLLVRHVLGW
jgi:Tfp pilus assembly protein PilN